MCVSVLMNYINVGILVTVRAVISESSNDANQAFGFSIITFSWLLAVVVSSAVSGVTADPIGQYNLTLPSRSLHVQFVMHAVEIVTAVLSTETSTMHV